MGTGNIFIRNSWGTEVLATVEDSVLRNSWGTEFGCTEGPKRCSTPSKKVRDFPVPSRDVTTKLSLGGNNDVITELVLPWGSLVSDIPAGDGKLGNLFFTV
jgi:hypothetical protein